MTLAEGRSFEEVAPGDIDKALERQRRPRWSRAISSSAALGPQLPAS